MISKWIEPTMVYDGSQLRSLYAYMNYKISGDSIVSWSGPCDIPKDKIVDGEDLLENAQICGSHMLHFIVELFHEPLVSAVAFQRLMAAIIQQELVQMGHKVLRSGDDLYWNEGKLSISIAAKSPMSSMIHFAINISNEGTPVKTASLEDLKVRPQEFAKVIMKAVCDEREAIQFATVKVKPLQ